ncbi:F-box domain-containing protein [Mycena indigotica]|uniref:F-box domain-containing protein n=1 Tax=Mycena indigotica TaxID=2126181 RepID=A0A8H6WC52_9AGAR|nr:F-box domain-containing protein [Mycena indigotica]KAF7309393.1 F-box domain-containing protein [Mycena indigotica]
MPTTSTLTYTIVQQPQPRQLYHFHPTFFGLKQEQPVLSSPPQYLLRLPQELLDEILSELDHVDLVAVALVSRACSALVIPRHTEYRVIRTRHLLPAMWAHLARRADLARNIREVHIAERSNRTTSDRIPRTLLLAEGKGNLSGKDLVEANRVRNICAALGHMQNLHTFTWSWEVSPPAAPTVEPGMENAVLNVLLTKTPLRRLGLAGLFGLHAPTRMADPESLGYPLWRFGGLRSLALRGQAWIRPANAMHVKRMLSQSLDLEASMTYLELPMELAATLAELKFPSLTHLNLFLDSGAVRTLDTHVVRFLAAHPHLTHLSWTPLGQVYLSPTALPSLRALQSTVSVISMLDGCSHLESLDIYQLDPATLIELAEAGLNGEAVRQVRLHSFGDIEELRQLATLFPNISWLSLPSRYTNFSLDDWLDLLPRFTKLEVFRGQGLWAAVTLDMTKMHGVILRLVQLCPQLRELDHCSHNQTRGDWNRIRIIREGKEGECIRYVVERPPARRWFDALDGAFD